MDLKAVVISGEAPESDDDETLSIKTGLGFPLIKSINTCGSLISGEAPESDDDRTSLSSVSGALDAAICQPYADIKSPKPKKSSVKYNTLLHKKLRECNLSLNRNILQLSETTVGNSVQELTNVNRHLLRSEMNLQDAACQLRNSSNRLRDTCNVLHRIADSNFFSTVNTSGPSS